MVLASKNADEEERVAELESYGVLDSANDPAFDEVVDLLATMLDMPVALISLVDSDRQWFRARHGFAPTETPLEQSICSHAILGDDILEIEDTLADERTADNPLCCGVLAEMRYYAGAPLITRNGHNIGSLCVLDTRPRKLTPEQRQLLSVMARQVMRQLDLQRALKNKEILREEIDHRVKNSLQTVASTVRLYRSRITNEEAREALDAIGRRVDAIAQLHAELNLTSKMHHVRLDSYLERVAQLLQRNAMTGTKVEIEGASRIEVDSRVAAALGVIANEFSANAAKYAEPETGGEILIQFRLERTGSNRMRLICRDNGRERGAERETDTLSSGSLGARLMEAAATQIGGTLSEGRVDGGFELCADLPIDMRRSESDRVGRISRKRARGAARAAE